MILLKPKQCLKCAACVPLCPTEALYLDQQGLNWVAERCTACHDCVLFCPVEALETADVH